MAQASMRFGLLAVAALSFAAPVRLWAQAPVYSATAEGAVALHRQRAVEALRANDRGAAEREYRAILALDPRDSAAWTGLGVLQYGEGKAHDASQALGEALRIDPSAPRAELFLALSRADLGECSEATPLLAKHFASEPAGHLQRLTGLALLGCTSGAADPLPAEQIAARLKQLYPGDADVLYASAELYTRLWNESAGELLAAHPDSYRVHQLAGEVYEAQKNYDQAIREYGLALAANSRLPQMHFRIGQLYLQQGGPDADAKAIEEFRLEQAANPNSAVAALAIAEIDRHQHKLDDAKALYEQAVRLDPKLVEARVGLAQTLIGLHQLGPAVEQLHAVLADHPENAPAHYALMLAYREQGKLPEAAAEMATFRQLQTASDRNFQGKLNALLNARPPAGETLSK
jgi:predicted Zn-dependent protease